MTIQEINSAIIAGLLTNDQLTSIQMAVKFAKGQLVKKNKAGLCMGDDVAWTSVRTGQKVTGAVVKISTKYVTVRAKAGLWKIPANMLEVV